MSASTSMGNRMTDQATDGWVSIREAARLLGIARPTVLTKALRGELVVQTVAGRTVVSRESIERARSAAAPA